MSAFNSRLRVALDDRLHDVTCRLCFASTSAALLTELASRVAEISSPDKRILDLFGSISWMPRRLEAQVEEILDLVDFHDRPRVRKAVAGLKKHLNVMDISVADIYTEAPTLRDYCSHYLEQMFGPDVFIERDKGVEMCDIRI